MLVGGSPRALGTISPPCRKLTKLVDQGTVTGWDDPRMPTVRGVLRRGLTVEALKEFVMTQGASRNTNSMSWDKIWAINKQRIDPVIPRFCAIEKQSLVELTLSDGPAKPTPKQENLHPKDPTMGTKTMYTAKTIYLRQDDAQVCGRISRTCQFWLACTEAGLVATLSMSPHGRERRSRHDVGIDSVNAETTSRATMDVASVRRASIVAMDTLSRVRLRTHCGRLVGCSLGLCDTLARGRKASRPVAESLRPHVSCEYPHITRPWGRWEPSQLLASRIATGEPFYEHHSHRHHGC